MKKKLTALILAGALSCAIAVPAAAADSRRPLISPAPISEETPSISHSVLYYGTVKAIIKDEAGVPRQLHMTSERYGEYVMNLSEQTVWIDSGNHTAADPVDLREGEGIYVFHSPAATRSLPPQSTAYAVVRNVPMDAGCAQYHQVEEVTQENGQWKITTDNGGLFILADEKTGLSIYDSEEEAALEDIRAGGWVMAWYEGYAAVYPGQTYAHHLMLLPTQEEETLTRAQLVTMLHEHAGKPVVNYAMKYSDVSEDAGYAEAVRWAASEGIASGHGNGKFGPDDTVSREQLVTILWRYAGSPMLMDYPGLTTFQDIGELSVVAQPAMAWAHQKGFISALEGALLAPRSPAALELARTILAQLG